MSPDLLHVAVPVFNPRRYKSHTRNTAKFLEHMIQSGVRVIVAECTYGDAPPVFAGVPGIQHVHVQANTVCWIKEALLNLAIARLPRDWKHVAWIDADLTFHRPDWASETVYALQHHEFVQPWEHCYDLGPHGEHMELHHSFCRQWVKEPHTCDKLGASGYRFAHPGYAWATSRSTLEKMGGLIETAVLGAADHHQALALIGKARLSIPEGLSGGYAKPILRWEERANQHIGKNISYVPGTISHSYHGQKAGRAYISRWDILKKHGFDPETDLKRNTSGVLELTGNKPEMRRDIMAYFADRDEDSSTIAAEMFRAA
jgi:hypothetical protein